MSVLRALIVVCVASLTAAWLPAADPEQSFRVPYRITDTKHVLVRVKLNGTGPYNFILDTGAPSVFANCSSVSCAEPLAIIGHSVMP